MMADEHPWAARPAEPVLVVTLDRSAPSLTPREVMGAVGRAMLEFTERDPERMNQPFIIQPAPTLGYVKNVDGGVIGHWEIKEMKR